LRYLDVMRVPMNDINLHSDTWWTLPLPFSEKDVLRDIDTLRKDFFERTGMFFNTYALDLGWSDRRSIWRIDAKNFPNGFRTINDRLAQLNCRLGLWMSPSSAYPEGLDNTWLKSAGYEVMPAGDRVLACFALGGRYQREFTERATGYAAEYGMGHIILDALQHSCDVPSHLHATGAASSYAIHDGYKDIMDRLRRVNPNIIIEPLNCGLPPSPWWNTHSPLVLGPAGDDAPYGRVPSPDWSESLISARDIVYRTYAAQWLVRTQAMETFDIILQSPGSFKNQAVIAAGRGRWFMSCNVRPELMKPDDWDFLAGLVRWQRENKRYLTDAQMFGGKAENREAYGYLFHNADRDIYCVRNPWIEERTIRLPARVNEARDINMIYPRRTRVARIQPDDDGATIVLGPYETVFLDSLRATEDAPPEALSEAPRANLIASGSDVSRSEPSEKESALSYSWRGSVEIPDLLDPEICVLVEGSSEVAGTAGNIWIDGRAANVTRTGSAGQFGAAGEPSPENWTWFIARTQPGTHTVEVRLDIPLNEPVVGIFLRGAVTATSDAAPEGVAAFPVNQPDRRPCSQTLQPLTKLSDDSVATEGEALSPIGVATVR
jgi:hypothetical protein